MEIGGYKVRFGNGLEALFLDRARADDYAARSEGEAVPLYELTEDDKRTLLGSDDEA